MILLSTRDLTLYERHKKGRYLGVCPYAYAYDVLILPLVFASSSTAL